MFQCYKTAQTRQNVHVAAANLFLQLKWDLADYENHRFNVRTAHHCIDNKPPRTYPHLYYKPKKLQLELERFCTIQRHNEFLLAGISRIQREGGWVDHKNFHDIKSLNTWKRQQETIKLACNNQTMLSRLLNCHTDYNRSKFEDEYLYPLGMKSDIDKWILEKQAFEIVKRKKAAQKEADAKKKERLVKQKHEIEAKERKKRNLEYLEHSKKWREARQERLRLAEKKEKEEKEREAEKKRFEEKKLRQHTDKVKEAVEKFKQLKVAKKEKELKAKEDAKRSEKTKTSPDTTRRKLELEEWKRMKKEKEEKEKKKGHLEERSRTKKGKEKKEPKGLEVERKGSLSSKTEGGKREPKSSTDRRGSTESGRSEFAKDTKGEDHEDRKKQSRQSKAKVSGDESNESDKGESNKKDKYKKSVRADEEIEARAKDKKSSERSLGYHLSEEGKLEELIVSEEEEEGIPEVPEKDKTLSPETEKGGTETEDVVKEKEPASKTDKGRRKSSEVRIGYHLSEEGKLEDLIVSEEEEEEETPETDRKPRSATRKEKSEKVDVGKEKESASKTESGRRKSSEVRIGYHLSEEGKLEDLIASEDEEEEEIPKKAVTPVEEEKVEDAHSDRDSTSDDSSAKREKKDKEEKK
ncbi:uncharacterized protein CDAR_432351 [Caerostris darwini]|uniref:Uncharacterized protein n=1 Tax=Caerostris darwini TaxID=1538125 RepID=A0AAV4U2X4_9ARAC|nr:uncharacterized protein CDAR_432351 [Caerostris darwini]